MTILRTSCGYPPKSGVLAAPAPASEAAVHTARVVPAAEAILGSGMVGDAAAVCGSVSCGGDRTGRHQHRKQCASRERHTESSSHWSISDCITGQVVDHDRPHQRTTKCPAPQVRHQRRSASSARQFNRTEQTRSTESLKDDTITYGIGGVAGTAVRCIGRFTRLDPTHTRGRSQPVLISRSAGRRSVNASPPPAIGAEASRRTGSTAWGVA